MRAAKLLASWDQLEKKQLLRLPALWVHYNRKSRLMRPHGGPRRRKPVPLRDRRPNRESSMRHSRSFPPRRVIILAYRGPAVFASVSMRTAMQEMSRLSNPLEMVFWTKRQLALSGNGSLLPATNGLLRFRSLFRLAD
jgi:hypothetical protein